jgi:putative FmdB family regulatory protein
MKVWMQDPKFGRILEKGGPMPLYEYVCNSCKTAFEQITSSTDPDQGKCPKCHGKDTKRTLSSFRIAGQGDLRESTFHGCHDHFTGTESHSHANPFESSSGGHVHGPGCNHGNSGNSGNSAGSGKTES